MKRVVITVIALAITSPASAQLIAATPLTEPSVAPPASPAATLRRASSDVITAGLRFDVGSAFSYGVGFLRVHEERWTHSRGLGGSTWWGGGVDLRALSIEGDSLDAVQVNAVGRISMLGCSGAGLEATLGVATSVGVRANGTQPTTVAVGSLGVFMGVHYLLLGYSYQVPLGPFERPDWLASHQLSVRLEIPVARTNTREWEEPESARE